MEPKKYFFVLADTGIAILIGLVECKDYSDWVDGKRLRIKDPRGAQVVPVPGSGVSIQIGPAHFLDTNQTSAVISPTYVECIAEYAEGGEVSECHALFNQYRESVQKWHSRTSRIKLATPGDVPRIAGGR